MLEGTGHTQNETLAAATTVVARIARIFGSEGELIINLFDTFPQDFNTKEPLFVKMDGLTVPLFCDRFERRGRSNALVVFADMNTKRRAEELIGKELGMLFEEESEDGEPDENDDVIYLEDLVGLRAVLNGGQAEGRIENFIDGENPLFQIDVAGKEVFIPAVDEMIAETDLENGTIRFDLPEGLLDLYME